MDGEKGRGRGGDSANAATAVPGMSVAARTADRKRAPTTSRACAADWHHFSEWCRSEGHASLPTASATLAAYLSTLALTLGRSALDRRVAAIAHAHRARSLPLPDADSAARRASRAVKRQAAPGPHRPPPPTGPRLARMAGACPGNLAGLRDRALLLLAAATGLGRAALVAIDAEHVRFTADSCDLVIRRAPDAAPVMLTVVRAPAACPVRALQDWMRASDCSVGPVFRKVDRWGNVEHRRLGADAIRRILRRRDKRSGRTRRAASTKAA
jgi:hypothetical protein